MCTKIWWFRMHINWMWWRCFRFATGNLKLKKKITNGEKWPKHVLWRCAMIWRTPNNIIDRWHLFFFSNVNKVNSFACVDVFSPSKLSSPRFACVQGTKKYTSKRSIESQSVTWRGVNITTQCIQCSLFNTYVKARRACMIWRLSTYVFISWMCVRRYDLVQCLYKWEPCQNNKRERDVI